MLTTTRMHSGLHAAQEVLCPCGFRPPKCLQLPVRLRPAQIQGVEQAGAAHRRGLGVFRDHPILERQPLPSRATALPMMPATCSPAATLAREAGNRVLALRKPGLNLRPHSARLYRAAQSKRRITTASPAGQNPHVVQPGGFRFPCARELWQLPPQLDLRPGSSTTGTCRYLRTSIFTENMRIQLRFEAFNVFNHTQWANVNNGLSAPTSGTIFSGANAGTRVRSPAPRDPRQLQLGGKFYF